MKKHWEIIADNLSKAGFSLGWVSVLDVKGLTIWIVDAHLEGKRFIARIDAKLTPFIELERDSIRLASMIATSGFCEYAKRRARVD